MKKVAVVFCAMMVFGLFGGSFGLADDAPPLIPIYQLLLGNSFVPSNFKAMMLPDDTIRLTWKDNARNETGFKLLVTLRLYDGNVKRALFTLSADTEKFDLDLQANNLMYMLPSSRYFFSLLAYNDTRSASPDTLVLDVPGNLPVPSAPVSLSAIPVQGSSTSMRLSWTDTSNNEEAFIIYRSETDNFNDAVQTTITAPDLTSHTLLHLDPCKTYYFWVAAKNTTGQSVSANYATAMTAPDAPEDVYTTNYTIRSTTLYWQNNVDQCAVRYHVYAKAPEDDSYTEIPDADNLTDGSVGSVNVGITSETYIYYRVAAENNDGTVGPMSCTVKSGYRSAYAYNHAGCNAAVGYAFGDKPKYPWASTDESTRVIFTWDDVPIQYNSNGSAVSLYANCFRIAYKIGAGGWVNYTDCLQNPTIQNNWQYQSFEINQMSADTSATIRISTHYLYDTDGNGSQEDVYSEPITITGWTLPNGGGGGGVAALGTAPWVTASHYFPGKIMVGWTTSSNATSYQVYRGNWNGSCAGTSYGSYRTFSAGQSSFDDMVGDWKQFCYKVRACNNGVCTAFSSGEYGNSGGL